MASGWFMLFSILSVLVFSSPEQILPTAEGTAWEYKMTEEAGPGARLSDDSQNETGTMHLDVVYCIQGTREMDGRKL